MLNEEKVYQILERWNDDTDHYLGSLFGAIYHKCPECYYFQFNDDKEIFYDKYINKRIINKASLVSSHCLDDRNLLLSFINKPDDYMIINYSQTEYLILGKKQDILLIIIINDSGDKSLSVYQTVYVDRYANHDFLEELKPFFEYSQRHIDIDFGIAAVDASGSIYTNYYDYYTVDVDIKKNYNDDIPYDKMINILKDDSKSSLMLFYGDPGTGKSTIIKHFIGKMPNKEFVFVDGALLANVQQDRLMSYFLENQDTVFIFEDCEKILLSRDHNYNPTMSILLNLTDGIISDVLNIKIICTFNTSLSNIDKALLRKGRLTMKYEFKKLNKEKAQKLLPNETVTQDMSLADIYNYYEENDFSKKQQNKIGFSV